MSRNAGARSVVLALALALVATAAPSLYRYAQAASALLRVADPHGEGTLQELGATPVRVTDRPFLSSHGPVGGRLYAPYSSQQQDDELLRAPALVLGPGVHRLGIDEPRLVGLARALAATGLAVYTPELRGLATFHIEKEAVDTIGEAAHVLRAWTGGPKVGLLGISFGGGLCIVAASDGAYAGDVAFVATIGAHDDLGRVLRYFVTGSIPRPDGSLLFRTPHEYGPLVVAYDHAEALFSGPDLPVAREAMRLWLWEDFDAAKKRAEDLSPEGKARMSAVFEHRVVELAPALIANVAAHEEALRSVSPSAHVQRLRAPLLVLHGEGDAVVPPTEALWLAHDAPPSVLEELLVSRAVSHAEMRGQPSIAERLALVRFLADLVQEARHAYAAHGEAP